MTTYLLAGGGTAGHVNPLLAVADALRAREPDAQILVLGTREGLEARLVPERGYELLFVDKVPFPRRPDKAAAAFPTRFRRAIAQVRAHIRDRGVEVVVGFGGYASAPAYVAARRARVPIVVHEANAARDRQRAGCAAAAGVGVAFEGTPTQGRPVVGMPLRREIVDLDRAALRARRRVLRTRCRAPDPARVRRLARRAAAQRGVRRRVAGRPRRRVAAACT